MNHVWVAIIIFALWFFLPLLCGVCLPCVGVDVFSFTCQAVYNACVGGQTICYGIVSAIRMILLIIGTLFFLSGLIQIFINGFGRNE